jgi:hypothetical protein
MDKIESDRIKLQRQINKILSDPFWIPTLATDKAYVTTHDDCEGDFESGYLNVYFSKDGDAWIETHGKSLRFRTWGGGGRFLKIRNALLLLAEAIRQEGVEPNLKEKNHE